MFSNIKSTSLFETFQILYINGSIGMIQKETLTRPIHETILNLSVACNMGFICRNEKSICMVSVQQNL